jgi:hypothetical protein
MLLFEEYHPGEAQTGESFVEFLRVQKKLLESHRFHTEEATALFPHQTENLELTRQRLYSDPQG